LRPDDDAGEPAIDAQTVIVSMPHEWQETAHPDFGTLPRRGDARAAGHRRADVVAPGATVDRTHRMAVHTRATACTHAQTCMRGTKSGRAGLRGKGGHRPHRCLQLKERSFPATKGFSIRRRAKRMRR
jgi:hypothetical protein